MQRSKKILTLAAATAVAHLSLVARSNAAEIKWDGGGADNNLATPENWAGDVLPAIADTVRFDALGATKLTPSTDGAVGTQYLALFFGNLATAGELDAYTIGGANALTLGSTAAGQYLNNDSEALQTINAPVNMIGGNINATNAGLHFGGVFNVGNGGVAAGNNVTFQGANNITLAGGIAGAGTAASAGASLNKGGAGTLFVTADSAAWQGRVFINGGAVQVSNANALGSGGGNIILAATSGGTGLGRLELTGGITLTKNVETRPRQTATINEVHIRNVSGNNTVSSITTATGGTQFNYESAADNLTITSWNTTASGGGRILRVLGAGNGEIQNWTPVAGNVATVIKDGAGTWTLRAGMNHANGVFGPVTVNGGTLVFDAGLGARVVGSATILPHVTVNSGGTLQVVSTDGTTGEVGNGVTPTTLNVKAGGTLNASTFSTYTLQAGQTLVGGGTIQAGALRADGDNIIRIGDVATPAAGTLNVQGNLSLSNNFAAANGGVHFDLSTATAAGNDLISVQGDLQIDTSGGPVNLYVNPLGAGFATGTYRLFDFTGASLPSASDFNLIAAGTGTTRQNFAIATAANQVNLDVTGGPASLVWAGDGSGNAWEVLGATNNWLLGATPDKFYQFDSVTFDNSSTNTTVNLSGTLQPGMITVDSSQNYTFQGGGALAGAAALIKSGSGTLTIANTGPNTLSGAVTINAGTLQLGNGGVDGWLGNGDIANDGALAVNKSSTDTYSGVISGTGTLTKQGSGTLILTGANTYSGATTIDEGTLQVGNGGTTGWFGTGAVTTNGTLAINRSDAITYAGVITGTGGVTKLGGAVLELTGANTYTGTTAVNGGTLRATIGTNIDSSSNLSIGNGVLKTTNATINRAVGTGAGQIQFTGGNVVNPNQTGGGFATDGADLAVTLTNGGAPIVWGAAPFDAGFIVLNEDASTNNITLNLPDGLDLSGANVTNARRILSRAGTTTINGAISGATGQLQLDGPDVASAATTTIVLTQTSTFAGGTEIDPASQGKVVVRAAATNALGTGQISLAPGGNATQARLELTGGITLPNAFFFPARNNDSVAIQNVSGDNTLSGRLTMNVGGDRYWIQSDAGTLTLSGADAAAGGVAISAASGTRNLTLRGAGNGVVSGVIENGGGTVAVTKADAGTWTLSGANTYTGATTVNAGTLKLGSNLTSSAAVNVAAGTLEVSGGAGYNRVLKTPSVTIGANGRIDLKDNKLITDTPVGSFTGGAYTGIQGEVARAYNFGSWDLPGLTTSEDLAGPNGGPLAGTTTIGVATAEQVMFLAPTDTGIFAGQTVTGASTIAMYTYAGDVNFDGLVDAADYGVIDNWVQFPGTDGYANGDLNYDGVIDAADYGIIDNTIQLQGAPIPGVVLGFGAAASASIELSGVTAVPEPSACGLALVAAASLFGHRRRRRHRRCN